MPRCFSLCSKRAAVGIEFLRPGAADFWWRRFYYAKIRRTEWHFVHSGGTAFPVLFHAACPACTLCRHNESGHIKITAPEIYLISLSANHVQRIFAMKFIMELEDC
jgi:hypothetical protein